MSLPTHASVCTYSAVRKTEWRPYDKLLRCSVVRTVHVPKPDVVHTTLLLFLVRNVNVAKLDVVYTHLHTAVSILKFGAPALPKRWAIFL